MRSAFFSRLACLICAIVIVSPIAHSQTAPLPELGDSATRHLNPLQEAAIGQNFYRHLLTNADFITDYELRDYLQNLGERVGIHADLRGLELTFSLVKDNSLNAFAVPGGYITFHSGLIMSTESESQLASVIGHEIAHLTQRHLPRLLARADAQKLPAIAVILGSILIGGQAGVAGITATSAALAGNRLRYSREFEKEADAIGIKLLAEAQYDPNAMAAFFGKLERFTRHDSAAVPDFLKTHPVSYSRVAESEIRAKDYPTVNHQSSFEYYLARSRIRALLIDRQDDPILFFDDQLKSANELKREAAQYGAAAVYLDKREAEKAQTALGTLGQKYADHPWIQVLQAEIEFNLGLHQQAIDRLLQVQQAHPEKLFISYNLARAYLDNDQAELAKKSLRYHIRRNPENYELYSLLSDSNAKLGLVAEAHQAKAEYHAILGNYERAVVILKQSLKETDPNSYLGQSIKARIPQLEELERLQKLALEF